VAQHDFSIANQSGSSFRADLNNALSAVVSQNSGSAEPTTMFAYQMWADTTAGVMKLRNGANSAWITLYELDGTFVTTDIKLGVGTAAAPSLTFTGRLTIDSSGRLLVGTSTARSNFYNTTATAQVQVEGVGAESASFAAINVAGNAGGARLYMAKGRGGAIGSNTIVSSGDTLGQITFQGNDGSEFVEGATIEVQVDGTPGANDMPGRLVFSTSADGASTPTERMRITNDGVVLVGTTNTASGGSGGNFAFIAQCFTNEENRPIAAFRRNDLITAQVFGSNGGDGNAANCSMRIRSNSGTSRSINAGGTINGSGADYAEYMSKAGDFALAKGDVCGVTADGLLTDTFADAISFLVKSTNPSYVGGDTWGNAEVIGERPEDDADALAQWEVDLEAARQKVDRIAFAGQVPVNITGALPGQYIIPIETEDGGITGVAKNEADLTLAEYIRAVGRVIAIEDDGRARIIVKVA